MPFFILFFVMPLIELYVFLTVGEEIGILKTLILCLITAVIGGYLVRMQGLGTLMKAQNNLRTGKMPLNEIFTGFCIVIAGALLLTPGFVTDITGFLLLFPPFRAFLRQFLTKNTHFKVYGAQNTQKSTHNNNDDDGVIEGNYEKVDKNQPSLDKNDKTN